MQIGFGLLTIISAFILVSVIHSNLAYNSTHTPSQHSTDRDFYMFYMASNLMKQGKVDEIYIPEKFDGYMHAFEVSPREEKWLYPPDFLPLVSWLAYFDYFTAYGLWIGAQMLVYSIAISGYLAKKPLDYIFLLGLPSFALEYTLGQCILFFAALVVAGYRYLETKPRLSGIMWGLACVKPTVILLVPFLLIAKKKYQTLMVMFLTLLATSVITIFIYGLTPWIKFITVNIFSYKHFLTTYDENIDQGMITINAMFLLLKASGWIKASSLFFMALFCIVFVFRNYSNTKELSFADIAIIQLLTILASPYGFNYEMTIPIPFALYAIRRKYAETKSYDPVLIMAAIYSIFLIYKLSRGAHLFLAPFFLATIAFYLYRKVRGEPLASKQNFINHAS